MEYEKANLIFLDAIESHNADTVKQLQQVSAALERVIESLQKKKKWKMTPNRNFQTKLIQEVIIEQVED